MEPKQSKKNKVIERTENPVHEGDLKWTIDNACKLSARVRSSLFSIQTECQPEFQIVAKFNERYPEGHVTNVVIGIQRIDSGDRTVHVTADAQLLNTDGDEYCRQEVSFSCVSGGSPFYIFSEVFADSSSKLQLRKGSSATGISSADVDELFHLQMKNLIATHGNASPIFILPQDTLVVQVHIKTFGCCVVTTKEEVLDAPERQTLKSHVDQLLNDFELAFRHQNQTDTVLVVGDKAILAHKLVLQIRSPVFRNMFEHKLVESTAGTIQIDDVDYAVLEALIKYMYSAVVPNFPYDELCDLYEAADKYQVLTLQRECAEIIKLYLTADTACRTLILADMHNDSFLRQEAVDYIWRNFAKVKATEDWELTVRSHQKVTSEILKKVCNFKPNKNKN